MSARVGALCGHFEDIEQQRGAERLGMWMFLATEILFFGGVFLAYTVYRNWYSKDFAAISSLLNVTIAGINSVFLLVSSMTITFAIRACQLGNNSAQRKYLLATALLGSAFMGLKAYEYATDYHEGLVPWSSNFGKETLHGHEKPMLQVWEEEGVAPERVKMFLFFYYCMTGIHGVHLIIGIACVLYLYIRSVNKSLTADKYVAIEVTSLYWHLVDAIWLFIMPLLYLAGPHTTHQLGL
ncbi:cytochrome c oxidase subunit 3 [Zavarzinella formosa]|uniref:cytochrome c oxidase subunit 3 n=1 Tax=Zavarzinella formosa TaxID=360055 RepID=UPI00037B4D79|nr:cytochrome c oxidase subunit 3 [Zavarzinella formosa]